MSEEPKDRQAPAGGLPQPEAPAAPGAAKAEPKTPGLPKPEAKAAPKPAPKPPPEAPTSPPDPGPPSDLPPPEYLTALHAALPSVVEHVSYWVGDWTIIVPAGRLVEVARFLRDAPEARFDYCSDVTAVDWPARPQRFDVVYCLYSIPHRHRVRLKVRAGEHDPVPSVTGVWPGANWLEREVYDLFGVRFTGHPDLRRILMPEEWQGHPQRKDYPLEGPGELLMENPLDWLRLRTAEATADLE